MPERPPSVPPPGEKAPADPARDGALPLEELGGDATQPTRPPVETALDDDEGGADPVDPDTGRPYDDEDPGTAGPPAKRRGGAEDD